MSRPDAAVNPGPLAVALDSSDGVRCSPKGGLVLRGVKNTKSNVSVTTVFREDL